MSNLEDYNKKIEDIKNITDDQIKTPHHVPVGIYTQEAEYLYEWCQEDKDELTAKGLVWTAVDYIREYGKYVFWINSARLKGYRSEYRRKLKQRTTRRNRVTEPEPGKAAVTIDS
jgi:hypothetical protein